MPALPDAPNVLRLLHQWKYSQDTDVVCRIFFRYAGTAPQNADVSNFLTAVHNQYLSELRGMVHPDVQLVRMVGTDLTTTSSANIGLGFGDVGTRTGTALPAGTCVLINDVITRRYRGGKPRTYFPGGTATDVSDGQDWTTAFLAAFATAWGNYINNILSLPLGTADVVAQCNVSYYAGVNPPITLPSGRVKQSSKVRTTALIDDITSHAINARYGSQRRRNRP